MKIELVVNGNCFICNKKFVKPFKVGKKVGDGIQEIEIITSHARCRNLVQKREKLIKQLVEIDFDLFCLQDVE